jgi:hypothetical protein
MQRVVLTSKTTTPLFHASFVFAFTFFPFSNHLVKPFSMVFANLVSFLAVPTFWTEAQGGARVRLFSANHTLHLFSPSINFGQPSQIQPKKGMYPLVLFGQSGQTAVLFLILSSPFSVRLLPKPIFCHYTQDK